MLLPVVSLPIGKSQQGGYQSVRKMGELSGLGKPSVHRALEELVGLRVIHRERRGDGQTALTMILPVEEWRMPTGERVVDRIQRSQE
jgi:hypothetical protein